MTQEQIKSRYEKKFFNSDLLISSKSNYPKLSFKTLKVYYSERGFHLDDSNFETNLSLKMKKVNITRWLNYFLIKMNLH